MPCARVDLLSVCTGLTPVFQSSIFGRHVVAKTQGYHLVCVWGSLVKFQGGEVVLKIVLYTRVPISFFFFVLGLTPVFQSQVSPSN